MGNSNSASITSITKRTTIVQERYISNLHIKYHQKCLAKEKVTLPTTPNRPATTLCTVRVKSSRTMSTVQTRQHPCQRLRRALQLMGLVREVYEVMTWGFKLDACAAVLTPN